MPRLFRRPEKSPTTDQFIDSNCSPSLQGSEIGDFNGDGIPDLIVANYFGNTATVLTSQLTQTAVATANSISPAITGTHNVDASYPGDSNYKSSVSTAIVLTGTGAQVAPTVTVSLSSSTISAAQALTATISVNGGSSGPTPTGAVSLTSGSYAAPETLSAGSASITVPAGSLPIGTDTLTASFTPDAYSSSLYTGIGHRQCHRYGSGLFNLRNAVSGFAGQLRHFDDHRQLNQRLCRNRRIHVRGNLEHLGSERHAHMQREPTRNAQRRYNEWHCHGDRKHHARSPRCFDLPSLLRKSGWSGIVYWLRS